MKQVNPHLNAAIFYRFEQAFLHEAQEVDRICRIFCRKKSHSLMDHVPTIKESHSMMPHTVEAWLERKGCISL